MTRIEAVVAFLNGGVAISYLVASVFFLRLLGPQEPRPALSELQRRVLLLVGNNLLIVVTLGVDDERHGYSYILRVLRFLLILLWPSLRKKGVGATVPPRYGRRFAHLRAPPFNFSGHICAQIHF